MLGILTNISLSSYASCIYLRISDNILLSICFNIFFEGFFVLCNIFICSIKGLSLFANVGVAETYIEECYGSIENYASSNSDTIMDYIDIESFARYIFLDFIFVDGYVFENI